MSKILVTGASGYLGHEIVKRLIERGDEVVALARNEGKLVELKEKFPGIEVVVGDVSDRFFLDRAMQGTHGCIHAAAMKHVGLAEQNPRECVESNVIGSLNVLEAAVRHGLEFVIGISTDKAASRSGVYGTTKYLMERLFEGYQEAYPETRFRTVRYGNVLDSTGSVTRKWRERILKGELVYISDPKATRFFWTVGQAVDLIFECLEKATDAKPYLTKMKSMRMRDLLEAMMWKYGRVEVKAIGLQPGENMHEIIEEGGVTSEHAEKFTVEEIAELI